MKLYRRTEPLHKPRPRLPTLTSNKCEKTTGKAPRPTAGAGSSPPSPDPRRGGHDTSHDGVTRPSQVIRIRNPARRSAARPRSSALPPASGRAVRAAARPAHRGRHAAGPASAHVSTARKRENSWACCPGLVAITAVPVRHKICVAVLDPQVLLVILDLPTHVSRSLTMHDLLGSPACMRLFTPEGTFTRDLLGSPACLPLSLKSCARGPE
jgi:hypothetical protein